MNRAERRKLGIKAEPTYNLTESQLNAIKRDAATVAVMEFKAKYAEKIEYELMVKMLAIPAMVLHDKFELLRKKTDGGVDRVQRFADMCLDLYDSFERDYVKIDELHEWLYEEAGVMIEKSGK